MPPCGNLTTNSDVVKKYPAKIKRGAQAPDGPPLDLPMIVAPANIITYIIFSLWAESGKDLSQHLLPLLQGLQSLVDEILWYCYLNIILWKPVLKIQYVHILESCQLSEWLGY